jgi:sugar phosphate isomerase/epimerase
VTARIAGAPISRGVCEVPGWGYQLRPDRAARVLDRWWLSYTEAVRDGMYRPLGTGDVDVAAIVSALGTYGYDGSVLRA